MPTRFVPLILSAFVLAACQDEAPEAALPDRPVLVHTVRLEPRIAERSFVATIRPRVESELSFRVGGKVARRIVDVGQTVRAGEPLAMLDDTDFRLQQEQAEAELAAARSALDQATASLSRIEKLRKAGHATAATLEREATAVEEARGRAARAERQVSLARNALGYAVLAADSDGVVTAAPIEPGQVLAAGQPAVRLARRNEKEAEIAVPEALLGAVRGRRAELSLWSAPDKRFSATLRELSPSADPDTRTYLARFSVPSADDGVELGMTGTLTLSDDTAPAVARLPLSALFNQGDGPAVWVVDAAGRPVPRPVEVAGYEARHVLVREGIAEGDRVIALGVQKLDAGASVRTVEALEF